MSAAITRRRLAPALFAPLVALVVLAGCTGQQDPDKWSDGIKDNFVEACDGTAAADEPVEAIAADLKANALPTEQCRCIIDELADAMDFSDFKAANSKRREETGDERTPLADAPFQKAYATCVPGFEGSSGEPSGDTSDGDATTTTTGAEG